MLTQKRWWLFTPEQGWQRSDVITTQQMLSRRARTYMEGCKVAEVDERIDVAALSRMHSPIVVVSNDVTDDELTGIAGELVPHFGPMPASRSPYLQARTVVLFDRHPGNPPRRGTGVLRSSFAAHWRGYTF